MTDFIISKAVSQGKEEIPGTITLVYQIEFLEKNDDYNKEILQTLKLNVNNENIKKIILLNQQIYTTEELGIESKKIKQIKLNKTLSFRDALNQIYGDNIKGYVIISNQNIFFDDTLKNIKKTQLADKRQIIAPNRYEYTDKNLKRCRLFGPRADSQDAFIFHTNSIIDKKMRRAFNFNISDINSNNKFLFLLNMLGFEIFNDPIAVRTYHNGKERLNELQKKIDKNEGGESDLKEVSGPFLYVVPKLTRIYDTQYYPIKEHLRPIKTSFEKYTNEGKLFNNDIEKFHTFLLDSFANEKIFSVFKINPVWSNIVYQISQLNEAMEEEDEYKGKVTQSMLSQYVNEANKRHIQIEKMDDIIQIVNHYINMLGRCDISLHYSPLSSILQTTPESHREHLFIAKKTANKQLNQMVLSPTVTWNGNNILQVIKDKKILVMTHYQDKLDEQKKKLKEIWNFNAFENCEIRTINAPVHDSSSILQDKKLNPSEFIQAYVVFIQQHATEVLEGIDLVLLTECHFNPMLIYFFRNMGKTVIDAGMNTELYFGLYNDEILGEQKELLLMYGNKNWVRV